ncbi:BACON domain-containing carbohydrate-binding protein [uncultured Bacteroides sp.]|uniref:BACON domain-containing protein n=1 Tax=uncultured Bacteroides sp. TaxID=162156 RepID=UPI0025D5DCCC|nr:BACON domain-containing carbohydrate-binding protein [uncultured Bacteroides sp.]
MKKHINSHYLLGGLLGILALVLSVSCDDTDIVRRVEPQIEMQAELFTGPSASRQVLPLHSTYPWFAESSASWIKLQRYRGQSLKPDSIVAEIEENPDMDLREGWIEVRLMDQMSTRIAVKQNGRGSLITLTKKVIYFNVNGGETTLDVITDLDWTTDIQQEDGFTFTKIDKNHLKVKVTPNTTGGELKKVVTLADAEKTTKTELTVIQTNVEKMLSISLTEVDKDRVLVKAGGNIDIPVSLNVGYDCVASDDWIKILATPSFEGDIVQDIAIKISVDPNTENEERNGYVVVRNSGAVTDVSDTLFISQRACSQIVYVKAGSSGDGTSWERAFGTVEEGIAACADYGNMELWIAAGEYQLKNWTYLKKGVNMYGGFKGTENKLKDRDMTKKSTLIAAPFNAYPSIYGNKMSAGVHCYVDGFVFTGSNVTLGEGSVAFWSGWILRNCIITNNKAYRDAGGAFFNATLINCLICNNTTADNGSAKATSSIVNAQEGTRLYNVTIVNNESSGSSSGLRINGGAVYNSVIWGNVHKVGTNHQGYLDQNKTTLFVNNAIQGGFVYNGGNTPSSTEGCIALNANNAAADGPLFVDVSANNYQLQSTSPLIDAGSNPAVQSVWDILGNKRIWGDWVDIGAFEYFTKD